MKRLYSFLIGILAIIVILGMMIFQIEHQTSTGTGEKLVIYNWGDYIDPELLAEFTEETGIEIQYDTFDSNEAMYTKIKQGGTTYDIAVPSDYMITKMMTENLLVPLDYDNIEGMQHIGQYFLNQPFDPNNIYSIPYFWGTLGIVYNEELVKEAPKEWEDLWWEDYENDVMLFDGAREVMGLGLNALGHSLNSKNPEELQNTVEYLYTLTPNIKAIVADEMKGYMIQGDAAIGVSFSGEASQMLAANDNLRYVVPSKGSNLWFDNIVIPKTVKNKEGAYQFINFMLRPENALRNAEYIGYATPNETAKMLLPEEIREDETFYPSQETLNHLEVYEALDKNLLGLYNDLYLQVKMYKK